MLDNTNADKYEELSKYRTIKQTLRSSNIGGGGECVFISQLLPIPQTLILIHKTQIIEQINSKFHNHAIPQI